MTTGGNRRWAGVLGWPVGHSLSPVLQDAAFRHTGVNAVYLAWAVEPGRLRAAVEGLRALGALGANVTMPHKEAAAGLMDELSPEARAVEAVNTIEVAGDRLTGHNTDVSGFAAFLSDDAGVEVRGRTALVLGAGGAARAVVKALSDRGASEIVVAARNPDKAEAVAGIGDGGRRSVVAWEARQAEVADAHIVVNATPVGTGSGDPLEGASFGPGQAVVDLVYRPPLTELVLRARAAGAGAWGGLGMLVHQGAASFRIWTGLLPPLEAMSAAALHALRGPRA